MTWKKFSVKCVLCGHRNRPDRSPRRGIELVLRGEFATCRSCGTKFATIRVPNRPLVVEVASTLQTVAPIVEIVGYTGEVPCAYGYA